MSSERRREALRQMMLIRRFDELALELIWSGEIQGVVHPYVGQEACAVGVCAALRPGDRVMSNHRGHGHCIAAGIGPRHLMAELFGRATGCCRGKGGSMHIADVSAGMLGANGIVGAGVPIAAGAALSDLLSAREHVTVTFFGDGATGQGVVFETMNIAALWRLPIVFVCENNGIAAGTELAETIAVPNVAELAAAHGLRTSVVDGHDVDAVHDISSAAVAQVRSGAGPHFIECVLDRWRMHASRRVPMPDLRDQSALEHARCRDSVEHLRKSLIGARALDDRAFADLTAEVEKELADAVAYAKASPFPQPSEVLEHVFA